MVKALEAEDILLGRAVGFEGTVAVEVVGGEVCQEADFGGLSDGGKLLELEAGEFEDDQMLRLNFIEAGEEGPVADVAAEPDVGVVDAFGSEPAFEQVGGQGGGGALAVGAGYADSCRRAQFEEDGYLRCYDFVVLFGGLQELIIGRDCGVGYDDIRLLEIAEAVATEMELDAAGCAQCVYRIAEFFGRR